MATTRFDTISKLFAQRRLSRRQAVRRGAAGLAGAGLAAAGPTAARLAGQAAAQDGMQGTPASLAAEDGKGVPFLFVQTFGAGSLAPKAGEDGTLTLTADHLAGQTVYFSDRPERIVGMVDTARFLGTGSDGGTPVPGAGLGFSPTNPPNAALVFASADGDDVPGNVLVVELIDPTYDPATGRATYDVKVLADETAVGMTLVSEPVASAEATRDFTAASLFIDDCPDGPVQCMNGYVHQGDLGAMGYCYDWGNACCSPCVTASMSVADAFNYWTGQCQAAFPDGCKDGCWGHYSAAWACPTD